MPLAATGLRFPHERVFLGRTKLAYVHLQNLLNDAKRDRTARVSGYVAVAIADELLVFFLQRGEAVNAVIVDGSERRSMSINSALSRLPAEPELGEVCFHEASDEQLACMYRTLLFEPERWPEDVVPADPRSLFPYLRDAAFDGVVEVRVGTAVNYLRLRDGLISRTFFCDPPPVSPGEQLSRLFAGGGPFGRAQVQHWTGVPPLPVQAPPALFAAYREVAQSLVAELDRAGLPGAESAEQGRFLLLAEYPLLSLFDPSSAETAEPVVDDRTLTQAVAVWVTATLRGAIRGDDVAAARHLRAAVWDRRHMLQAAGFLSAVPWAVEW